MIEITDKTHYDYINCIGETHQTAKNYTEFRWNQYYFLACAQTVKNLLHNEFFLDDKTLLDVGCSHGSWFATWKKLKFKFIHGVELDAERANQSKKIGYNRVYNCDAKSIPVEDDCYEIACSNDVFVHILQLKDKLDIINEMYRIIKPGGVFIFNFPPPLAFGYRNDTVINHCSFYSLNTMIREIIIKSEFAIEDIKPSYYPPYAIFRKILGHAIDIKSEFVIEDIKPSYYPPYAIFRKILGHAIDIPAAVSIVRINDILLQRTLPIEYSSTIYIKLRKTIK